MQTPERTTLETIREHTATNLREAKAIHARAMDNRDASGRMYWDAWNAVAPYIALVDTFAYHDGFVGGKWTHVTSPQGATHALPIERGDGKPLDPDLTTIVALTLERIATYEAAEAQDNATQRACHDAEEDVQRLTKRLDHLKTIMGENEPCS